MLKVQLGSRRSQVLPDKDDNISALQFGSGPSLLPRKSRMFYIADTVCAQQPLSNTCDLPAKGVSNYLSCIQKGVGKIKIPSSENYKERNVLPPSLRKFQHFANCFPHPWRAIRSCLWSTENEATDLQNASMIAQITSYTPIYSKSSSSTSHYSVRPQS